MTPDDFQRLMSDPRSQVSGGPIERFAKGWAIIPFVTKPHYWRPVETGNLAAICKGQRVQFFRSLCGIDQESNPGAGLVPLGPGNFPKCKRCSRKAPR